MEVVSFDCDATLSTIEGIDWMARETGHGPAVEALTYVAMRERGVNASLYRDRLELVRPSAQLVERLVEAYCENVTPDAQAVIDALKAAGKTLCVLSAGLQQAVSGFAMRLGIQATEVGAVKLFFSANGHYEDYEHDSLLVEMAGKATWLETHYPGVERVHIGDGLNDIQVKDVGVHLVGFGGGQLHAHVACHCSRYIVVNSLAPLLGMILTENEIQALEPKHQETVRQGDAMIAKQGARFEATPGAGVC